MIGKKKKGENAEDGILEKDYRFIYRRRLLKIIAKFYDWNAHNGRKNIFSKLGLDKQHKKNL